MTGRKSVPGSSVVFEGLHNSNLAWLTTLNKGCVNRAKNWNFQKLLLTWRLLYVAHILGGHRRKCVIYLVQLAVRRFVNGARNRNEHAAFLTREQAPNERVFQDNWCEFSGMLCWGEEEFFVPSLSRGISEHWHAFQNRSVYWQQFFFAFTVRIVNLLSLPCQVAPGENDPSQSAAQLCLDFRKRWRTCKQIQMHVVNPISKGAGKSGAGT